MINLCLLSKYRTQVFFHGAAGVTTALSVRRHVEDNEVNMGLLHPQSSCMGKHLDYNKLVWSMLFLWFYARSKTVKWNSWEKAETVTLTHAARIPLRIQDLVVVKWYRIDFNSPELANRQKTNMKIAGVCFFFSSPSLSYSLCKCRFIILQGCHVPSEVSELVSQRTSQDTHL